MKKKNSLLLITATFSMLTLIAGTGSSKSFMSDKTEVSVDLEVSGAEALCQTDDGYVWIAQYSGLTRYDSREFVTYKSFTKDGKEYPIINVRALASKENTLYVATYESLYVYKDFEFSHINIKTGTIRDIILDEENEILYISSANEGGIIYDIKNGKATKMPGAETGSLNDIALDVKRDNYYYQLDSGVFDKTGKEIYLNTRILDIYTYGDILYMGQDNGVIRRYNMETETFIDDITVSDQVNKMLYSEEEKTLFVACDQNGLCCVNLAGDEPDISVADDLENKSQLVDLMIDYEGNLWIASHYIGASGVSIITKNALFELLYDDPIWKALNEPPSLDRNIYGIERHGDILYLVAGLRIYRYDLNQNEILPDNALMQEIDAYAQSKGIATFSPKDVEFHNGKIYFAIEGIGLVEYNPNNENVVIYGLDYIVSHATKLISDPDLTVVDSMRALRSFDGFLAIGYRKGIMKFDGTNFQIMNIGSNVLFIDKSKDGKLLFDRTKGIYEVDDDFTVATEIPTNTDVSGNRLKFLVDGDYIYYTVNSRLFRLEQKGGKYVSSEITIPYVKGSLVDLSKIEYSKGSGGSAYKYVIASQTQIYIADSLDGDQLVDYEFYDSTNGLQPIIANTCGYYDKEQQRYYFQSTNGVFAYDFSEERVTSTPVKVGVSSIVLDGTSYFGDSIKLSKDTYRVTINLSIFGFRPNKGYTVFYKMDGIDNEYHSTTDDSRTVNYTNLRGGKYTFHVYAVDEYGQISNRVSIQLLKEKHVYEQIWFWFIVAILGLSLIVGIAVLVIMLKTKQALRKQLEYKNITVESIQAIARTIDAKDEYTNGHSTRVGYYSRLIAENLGMKEEEVDNIYYIALLHDIGKIAIPDKILNKPGKLTDEEFSVMRSHTSRGAKILKGISTIPHIIEGAKSHHEKYDGTGYPDKLKGEEIPFVARIICCADCFDAMASKRVYKDAFSAETIIDEFRKCEGKQFDPKIAEVVINMIATGKLKPYSAENTYLGSDGKTHRITNNENSEESEKLS